VPAVATTTPDWPRVRAEAARSRPRAPLVRFEAIDPDLEGVDAILESVPTGSLGVPVVSQLIALPPEFGQLSLETVAFVPVRIDEGIAVRIFGNRLERPVSGGRLVGFDLDVPRPCRVDNAAHEQYQAAEVEPRQ